MIQFYDEKFKYGAAGLRIEHPDFRLGDIVKPGMLIQEGPDRQPYLVDRVEEQAALYEGAPCWGLTGLYAPGGTAVAGSDRRWWMNGWVAQRWPSAPYGILLRCLGLYLYDCHNRSSAFIIVSDQAFVASRAGQLRMF